MDKPNVPVEVRKYAEEDPEPSLFLTSRDKPNSFERHVQHFMGKLKPPSFLAAVFPPPPMLPSLQKTFMSFKPNESVYAAGNVNTHVQEGGTMYFQVPGEGAVELSTCKGNKKALLIGINYKNSKSPLSGCISDVQNIRKLIQKFYGFTDSNIVQLTDDSKDPNYYPTKENIFNSVRWLVDGSKPGDSLFFHFSGHGGISAHQGLFPLCPSPNPAVVDKADFSGKDETIFPVDYTTEGIITDVELHHLMVYTLPTGVRLTAIFDCCHSGTVLDLPYIYKCTGDIEVHTDADHHEAAKKLFEAGAEFQKGDKEDGFAMMKASMEVFKAHAKDDLIRKKWTQDHTTLADVVQFAGCKDDQTSADVRKHVGDTVIASGAMSYALIQILEKNPHPQYKDLLYQLRDILGQKKYIQVPQLCTGRPMDLTQEFSM